MKVHFLTENALEALRTNIPANRKHYCENTNDWIYDYFAPDMPFMEYKQDFPDFKLVFNENEEMGKIDVNNTIILYTAMKSLTDSQAIDERLWAGMCHYDFWDFLQKRWQLEDYHKLSERDIKSRFFFGQGQKRSLITNTLAKLWWIGRLTYDEDRSDPFELTKYLENDYSTKTMIIFSNNYMSNHNISVGLFSALKKLDSIGYTIKGQNRRDVFYSATRYLNVLGGTYILDYFTSEEIEEKIIKYMKSLKGATSIETEGQLSLL